MAKPKPQVLKRRDLKKEAAMGKTKFILVRGVIGWGLPAFLFYLALSILLPMLKDKLTFAEVADELFPVMFFLSVTVFAVIGIFMGRFRWRQLQEKLKKK